MMKNWKTYGKRKHLLPTKHEFLIEDERVAAALPFVDTARQVQDDKQEVARGELLASPVLSDNSSSIKSIEPAMERRVSLLLRGESPDDAIKVLPSLGSLLDSSPTRGETPSPSDLPKGYNKLRQANRQSSAQRPTITPQISIQSKVKPSISGTAVRSSNFNKRLSAIWSRQPPLRRTCEEATSPGLKSKEKNRNVNPLASGWGAGRKILERAKSAVTKSPSKTTRARMEKTRERRIFTETDNLLISVPDFSPTSAVYSPSSLFFDAPEIEVEPWVPTDKTRVPSRPYTDPFADLACKNGAISSSEDSFVDDTPVPLIRVLGAECDGMQGPVTPYSRIISREHLEDGQRLSMVGTDPARLSVLQPTVSVSPSIESTNSSNLGLIIESQSEHKLRHMTAKINRRSMLCSYNSNSTMNMSKRSRSIKEMFLSDERSQDVFTEAPECSLKNDHPNGHRRPLGERDPNKMFQHADEGTIRLAKAIRVSVSPKVREVFNKFPRRGAASFQPTTYRAADEVLSRSSSKASHILGHHVGSREPLRPPRGDQDTTPSFRECSSSEDELAT